MAVKQRMALTLPNQEGVERTLEQAQWAESEGYDDLWFADTSGIDCSDHSGGCCHEYQQVSNWYGDYPGVYPDTGGAGFYHFYFA